ncbi:MAG: hypothetical protein PHX50_08155 [Massilibacteroides sp.]|nr:hypothetical protein [Massilibacteroides sp.]
MRKITLPKRYFGGNFVIAEKFEEEKASFFKNFVRCNGSEFSESEHQKAAAVLSDIRHSIEQNFAFISEVLTYHENANPKASQIAFDTLMENIKDDLFVGTIDDWIKIDVGDKSFYTGFRVTRGHEFFRVRPTESFSDEINGNADEMFHIPISKRQNASNGRFSLAGFPSLYLSTMLPLAWQETGYPAKYYYSEYQYEYCYDKSSRKRDLSNDLQFISLYSPNEINFWGTATKYNNFDLWLKVIAQYLKTYPLTLACSFVNSSGSAPYKQEYIIPQMLMQWIQRNSVNVQGITYFTCLETSAITNGWCAYNIALPALQPHDEKMYSIRLKERFHWSKPFYYSIPAIDKKLNELDRKILDDFIGEITSAISTFDFPDKLRDCLLQMLNISSCMQSLFECADSTDMTLVLHMLSSIRGNFQNVSKISLEKRISEAKTDTNSPAIKLDEVCNVFAQFYNRFVERGNNTGEISKLIDKYSWTTWNELAPQSYLHILSADFRGMEELTDWLKNNHILYLYRLLKPDSDTVAVLKEIAGSQGISMDDFFGVPAGDDEWIKANIGLIKQPIIIKRNSVSILSPKCIKEIEFAHIGFDKKELGDLLKIT